MADNVPVETGNGSPARVAWDMAKSLRGLLPENSGNKDQIDDYLDLYARCYHAAIGRRQPPK
ncbi:MAG: hypothetical protein QHC65_06525 [Sphingomonas sp.]|nr:hypothetical protein [Sphingomonas sp.]MDX3884058.1 hypothetical protein [Sphingomonas sp.]